MQKNKKHFLDLTDLTAGDLRGILDVAHERKAARGDAPRGAVDADAPLADHILAMVFDKPSTRTRLSFDLAMRQLGGQTMIINRGETHLGRGESVADTARVVSRFADAAMLRTGAHERLNDFAAAADIPVVNALTAFSHPCQIVADLMTFEAHKGALDGQKISWFGDAAGNVAASLIHAAGLADFTLTLCAPPEFAPAPALVESARAAGANIEQTDAPMIAAAGAAAIITDCWVSMSDDPESADARKRALAPYQVSEAVMAVGDDPIFLHCLPAYRGEEVVAEVIDGARSAVFDEAENRCHAQKAILLWCLGV